MCDFDKEDAGDFIVDGESAERSDKVVFDGVMRLGSKEQINTTNVALANKFVSKSDIINTNNYKKINGMEISGIEGVINPAPGAFNNLVLSNCSSISNATKIADNYWRIQDGWAAFRLDTLATNKIVVQFEIGNGTSFDWLKGYMSIVRAGSSTRDDVQIYLKHPNIGSIYTIFADAPNQYAEVLENGLRLKKDVDYRTGFRTISASTNIRNNWYFAIEGSGTVAFQYFSHISNIPNGSTMNYKYNLYKKDNDVYGVVNKALIKFTDHYEALSDSQKIKLFESTDGTFPINNDIIALSNFEVLTMSSANNAIDIILNVVPKNQFVLPKYLIDIDEFKGIDKAVVTSNISLKAKCKLLITTDLAIYQTYDFVSRAWQTVDHTDLTQVANYGIDAAQLPNIPHAAWDTLTAGKTGIGFAYLLSIENTTDTCNVDKLELQVEMKGNWNKAVYGTDCKYG